ncbi:MAG: phosphotransferase [Fimbriimonas sp.]|nr:phosphotransferase [Fimbriimonas sp.]
MASQTNPWTPDVDLDDIVAAQLIGVRFADLDAKSVELIGRGWDNHAYLVDRSIVVRIPHRQSGENLMRTECDVLRYLSKFCLPLDIPIPKYVAEPRADYPYTIAGYSIIEGVTADSVIWLPEQRARNAGRLGAFLRELHRVPTNVPFALKDEIRRSDLTYRVGHVLERLKVEPPGFAELLTDLATTTSHKADSVWVHGDLYPRHLITDCNREVCGVIDWGDVHVGDPALDLAIAWMFLPAHSWPDFRSAYGEIDEAAWRRARFRAMTHWVYLSDYAEQSADEPLRRECEFLLANVMMTN